MPFIFVTGISGVGKSSVERELKRRGYEAYDSDEGGLTSWLDKETGKPGTFPSKLEDRTHTWLAKHTWELSRKKTEEMAEKAKDKLIFLCGSPSNNLEVWDLFDKVICLVTDDETLKHRIATRTENEYGKAPDELEGILEWNKTHESRYRGYGAIIVDAKPPLSKVVDSVLAIAKT